MYDSIPTSDLMKRALSNDVACMAELIKRQQDGRAFRLYPFGRHGAEDEGICAVMLSMEQNGVTIRSGRPSETVMLSKEQAQDWIFGMAELMSFLIHLFDEKGLTSEEIESAINSKATIGFDCIIGPTADMQMMSCEFIPHGMEAWVVPIEGARVFIRGALVCSQQLGWKMEATADQVETIKPFV